MLHGYGSCAALLYRIHKPLAERFNLIIIDVIGMGCSSRPDDYHRDLFDTERSTEYFVEYLEKWRVAMEISDFYLAGHSFGGYIVGNYAVKYHHHLKKVILMSPIGVKSKT